MHMSIPLVVLFLSSAIATPHPAQQIFSNPSIFPNEDSRLGIPTAYESAVMARRILHLTALGTLSTVFPSTSAAEDRPPGLGGLSIGLMDYIADCEESGNPTILAISIATTFKNIEAGSNLSLSLQWTPPYPPSKRISSYDPLPYSAANLPRYSLIGHLETISEADVESLRLAKCFIDSHPDAKYWLPGNRIHKSEWTRLVVEKIYWIGGFGDRAYIGWIPVEQWQNITRKEIDNIRLPGEKKNWKEWGSDWVESLSSSLLM